MGNSALILRKMQNKHGQSTLESLIVILLVVLFIGGIVNIWLWSNKQIVERSARYQASRVKAGTAEDGYKLQWPVYNPPDFTEGEVLLKGGALATPEEEAPVSGSETGGRSGDYAPALAANGPLEAPAGE